jgi:4-alpha-glucanotransferase
MDPLHALAAHAGVDVGYRGWRGGWVEARRESLVAVLTALGHDVADPATAVVAAQDAWWAAVAPPVVVSWGGAAAELPLRVRADVDAGWEVEVRFEGGDRVRTHGRLFDARPSGHVERGGAPWCVRHVVLPSTGELGYHEVHWQVAGRPAGRTRWIAAPAVAHDPGEPGWGVFAPLYALRTGRSGSAGDLGELARLAAHVAARGGRYVATLPMLAAFLDEPCEPSPYAPASRQFWNELYLDLGVAHTSPLPPGPVVDYRAQYAWRRAIIDRLAAAAWQGPDAAALRSFASAGDVADYAAFRALGEVARAPWTEWPVELRDPPPRFGVGDVLSGAAPIDRARWQSHVWAQWAMDRQLSGIATTGAALYLDLPVGVNRDAWEVWRHRDAFVLGAATGAPPDALFLGGQDWGLPPLHPQRIRDAGWDYVIACVRHHVRHAGMLRIDHVMGLHRLYWVPRGMAATDGVYVRYAADELYAILCLESQRSGCAIVGEDLGTVPDDVPPAMRAHGLAGLFVSQFTMPGSVGAPLGRAGSHQVASLNTHDTPTFAGWWRGADIDDKLALGLVDADAADRERRERSGARRAVLAAIGEAPADPDGDAACAAALVGVVRDLAASDAQVVLVTLEDAWLEPRPQNVPGTAHERPNWRRPFAVDADAALADPRVEALLAAARRAAPRR